MTETKGAADHASGEAARAVVETAVDHGLLSPLTAGHDDLVHDQVFLDAIVRAECALVSAYADIGVAPRESASAIGYVFGLDEKYGRPSAGIDVAQVAVDAVAGGNPVIPVIRLMKDKVPVEYRGWVHRGATSQDIWDSALLMVSRNAIDQVGRSLHHAAGWLTQLAEAHRDDVAAARTLTQHAVPTTLGARAAGWARVLRRAAERLAALEYPAQLAGAAGTLASFVEITGSAQLASDLVRAFARRTGLAAPAAPWHVSRWPITEMGDALVQTLDAVGKLAADVATLSRTEIGEVAEGAPGGSSAMPQKQNPTEAVLLRSAALRAPPLGATLHLAAALAVDERPDGAWHAEWPTLRELLRLALGASWHASSLAAHLRLNADQALGNLARSHGLIVSERVALVLGPVLGSAGVGAILADVNAGADLGQSVRRAVAASGVDIDVDALVDPARYTGLAGDLVDDAVRNAPPEGLSRDHP